MKTTRIIAGATLASLLVIGPLTMTRAHEPQTWPAYPATTQPGTSLAAGSGSFLEVDLRAEGLSVDSMGQSIGVETQRGLVFITVRGVSDYIVVTTPGSSYAALIQVDARGRLDLIAHMFYDTDSGRTIILVLEPDRPSFVLTGAMGMDDALDPAASASHGMSLASAGAILFASDVGL